MVKHTQITVCYYAANGAEWVSVCAPYSERFVEMIRARFADVENKIFEAHWFSEEKAWLLNAKHGAEIEAIAKECFPDLSVEIQDFRKKGGIGEYCPVPVKQSGSGTLKYYDFRRTEPFLPWDESLHYPRIVYRRGGSAVLKKISDEEFKRIADYLLAANGINDRVMKITGAVYGESEALTDYKQMIDNLNRFRGTIYFVLRRKTTPEEIDDWYRVEVICNQPDVAKLSCIFANTIGAHRLTKESNLLTG